MYRPSGSVEYPPSDDKEGRVKLKKAGEVARDEKGETRKGRENADVTSTGIVCHATRKCNSCETYATACSRHPRESTDLFRRMRCCDNGMDTLLFLSRIMCAHIWSSPRCAVLALAHVFSSKIPNHRIFFARIFGTTTKWQFARTADIISRRTRGKRARGLKGHSEISGTARVLRSLRRLRFGFEGVS